MPVVRALQSAGTAPSVWVTGQHREMLEPILAELDLRADLHLAPTPRARDNLLREGVDPATVHLVGNTVIDALFHARDHLVSRLPPDPALDAVPTRPRRLVLVTAHRRESFGPDLRAITEG